MKKQINTKVKFKFRNVKNERSFFSVRTDIYFEQGIIKAKLWTGKTRVNLSIFDEKEGLTQTENVIKETSYYNSIYSCLSTDEKILAEQFRPFQDSIMSNFSILSSTVMSELALDNFKKTNIYKMHCLYDKDFEKIFIVFK
jgi:hypothetical protein